MEEISKWVDYKYNTMVEAPKSNLVRISSRDESRPSNDGYLDQTDTFIIPTIGSIGPTIMWSNLGEDHC